jgi:hypothetical protein
MRQLMLDFITETLLRPSDARQSTAARP